MVNVVKWKIRQMRANKPLPSVSYILDGFDFELCARKLRRKSFDFRLTRQRKSKDKTSVCRQEKVVAVDLSAADSKGVATDLSTKEKSVHTSKLRDQRRACTTTPT